MKKWERNKAGLRIVQQSQHASHTDTIALVQVWTYQSRRSSIRKKTLNYIYIAQFKCLCISACTIDAFAHVNSLQELEQSYNQIQHVSAPFKHAIRFNSFLTHRSVTCRTPCTVTPPLCINVIYTIIILSLLSCSCRFSYTCIVCYILIRIIVQRKTWSSKSPHNGGSRMSKSCKPSGC